MELWRWLGGKEEPAVAQGADGGRRPPSFSAQHRRPYGLGHGCVKRSRDMTAASDVECACAENVRHKFRKM